MSSNLRFEEGVWTKYSESKRNPARWLQHILYAIPLFRPCYGTGDMRGQAKRLEQFREAGVPVPPVLYFSRYKLVTGHVGENLESLARSYPAQAEGLVMKAGEALLRMHQRKLAHGRPWLRDMAWHEQTVYFLDLEEEPLSVMPVWTAQVRDILLFTLSLTKLPCGPAQIAKVLDLYLAGRSAGFLKHLRRQLRLLDVLAAPLRLVPPAWRGGDLRTLHATLSLVKESLMTAETEAQQRGSRGEGRKAALPVR